DPQNEVARRRACAIRPYWGKHQFHPVIVGRELRHRILNLVGQTDRRTRAIVSRTSKILAVTTIVCTRAPAILIKESQTQNSVVPGGLGILVGRALRRSTGRRRISEIGLDRMNRGTNSGLAA